MQDSDDYFFDDNVVDEKLLAAWDEAETQYIETQRLTQLAQSHISRHPSPPPAKRLKLDHAWDSKPTRTLSTNSVDDLPEISVHGDGYNVERSKQQTHLSVSGTAGKRSGMARGVTPARNIQQTSRTSPAPRPTPTQRVTSTAANGPSAPAPRSTPNHRVPSTTENGSPGFESRPAVVAPTLVRANSRPTPVVQQPTREDGKLRDEVEQLRAQLERLRQEQAQMQETLKQATNARFAKEGEVTILRKAIEKTAQEHKAEVVKIIAAKDAAEAMQLQIKREMKEEMERLKTQYTFRQHELETSIRNSPWSGKIKRMNKQAPPTPVRIPTQMRQWNGNAPNRAGPSGHSQMPTQPQWNAISSQLQSTPKAKVPPAAKRAQQKAVFPGFVNAFDQSPSRSQAHPNKEKGKQPVNGMDLTEDDFFAQPQPQSQQPPHPSRHRLPPSSPFGSPTRRGKAANSGNLVDDGIADDHAMNLPQHSSQDALEDIDMSDEPRDEDEEAMDMVEPFDWDSEIQRLILTHRYPTSTVLTMQQVLSVSFSEQQAEYIDLSKRLLENLGTTRSLHVLVPEPHHHKTILNCLVSMAALLQAAGDTTSLTSLLNLLRVLALSLPSFSTAVLSKGDEQDTPPPICAVLCDIVRERFVRQKDVVWSPELNDLAKETLGLLEVLAWNVSEELAPRLSSVLRDHEAISILLATTQPAWLLSRWARVLALFATHASLSKYLLAVPDRPQAGDSAEPAGDPIRRSLIEKLAKLLKDASRQGDEEERVKETILAFIASLLVAKPDTSVALLQFPNLVLSIIVYLTHVTFPLFEEDEEYLNSPEQIEVTVIKIDRIVSLLYILVFSSGDNPAQYLRQRLQSQYDGVHHMFIVTLSRLSFADPPQGVDTKTRQTLDQMLDMSRELLGLVLVGPEEVMAWSAFQIDNEPKETVNDDKGDDEEQMRLAMG